MEEWKREPEIKVSVIMGVYNQLDRHALNQAVDSILNQTLQDIEFIIYDDGSNAEAAIYIKEQQQKDERIYLCGKEENHGLAFSLNACIELARGKYVARMDADDISAPDRLQVQYDFLESHPMYSWCGTNAKLFDGETVWGYREMPEVPEVRDYLRFSPYIHPTVMYRRDVLTQHPYLISKETLRCEDYEIFMRLRQNGFRGYNIQRDLFFYREDRSSYRRRKFRFRVNECKVRYRNFKAMHVLFPAGWMYVLRPIVGGLVPGSFIAFMKRKESGYGDVPKVRASSILPKAASGQSETLSGVK